MNLYKFLFLFSVLLTFDIIWFRIAYNGVYKKSLQKIRFKKISLIPFILAYIIMAISILWFHSLDITIGPLKKAYLTGLFGFFIYFIFNATLMTIVSPSKWYYSTSIIDTFYGTFLYFTVSLLFTTFYS
jgi:hypothetical protein